MQQNKVIERPYKVFLIFRDACHQKAGFGGFIPMPFYGAIPKPS